MNRVSKLTLLMENKDVSDNEHYKYNDMFPVSVQLLSIMKTDSMFLIIIMLQILIMSIPKNYK